VEVAWLRLLLTLFPTCVSLANKALQNGRVQVEDQGLMASKVGIYTLQRPRRRRT